MVLGRRGHARVRRPREVGGRRVEQRRPRRGTTNRQASGAETNRCGNSSFRRLAENERLRGKRLSGVGHLACCCRRLIGSLWDPERASEVRLVDAKTLGKVARTLDAARQKLSASGVNSWCGQSATELQAPREGPSS